MTDKQLNDLKRLQEKWASGEATAQEIRRCMALESRQRAEAAENEERNAH